MKWLGCSFFLNSFLFYFSPLSVVQAFLSHPLSCYRQNKYLALVTSPLFPPNSPTPLFPPLQNQRTLQHSPFFPPPPPPLPPTTPEQKLKKWIELLRPNALPPTLLLCFTGGWLMNPSFQNLFQSTSFLVATLCTLLITSTSMVINDVYDVHLDKIDHPTRPLPSGIITIHEAVITIVGFLGAVEYLSITYLRADLHWIIHISTAIIIIYTPILKRLPFIKNIACASLVTLSLFFTGLSSSTMVITNQPHFPLLCLSMSTVFFGSLYNEIVLDMRDMEGDRVHRIYTLPVLCGLPLSFVFLCFIVYLNLEWNFLSMYYLLGIPKAMGYLLTYSPLFIQVRNVYQQKYSKESLIQASKASSLPLLFVMLYFCILTVG